MVREVEMGERLDDDENLNWFQLVKRTNGLKMEMYAVRRNRWKFG